MNILFLMNEPDPRMTHFGGAQRTNAIWRALQELGDVYTMTFDQRFKTEEVAPRIWYVKKLQKVNPVRDFFYKVQTRVYRIFKVLYCFPLSTRIEKTPDEIFPNIKFDVVVCRYLDVLGEMHLWGHPRLIVDVDDDPLQMYDTVKSHDVHPMLRGLGRWILRRQVAFLMSNVSAVWVSNSMSIEPVRMDIPVISLRNVARCPSAKFRINAPRKNMIISVGALDYAPNYEGVDEFLSKVWPKVHARFPELRYAVVGRGTPSEYIKRWRSFPNVDLLGFVEDLEKVYEQCLCSVVSVASGGGTCIKTIESMAFSRICLTTEFGARGLTDAVADADSSLVVYHSAEEFIDGMNMVLVDVERAKRERHGREYVQKHCMESVFFKTIEETIEKYGK